MTSVSERVVLGGIALGALMLALTLVIGRFFCGWICPLGTVVDMAGALRKKTAPLGDRANQKLKRPKFFILAAVFILSVFGIQTAWFLDPTVITARFVSLNLIPAATLACDKAFIFMLKASGFHQPLVDLYRTLQGFFPGANARYFSHSLFILAFFLPVVAGSLYIKRFWCRAVCPLGALYALAARFSLLGRVVGRCEECGACKPGCRMGAVRDDAGYEKAECILCMDCVYDCRPRVTRFSFRTGGRNNSESTEKKSEGGLSRRGFLFLLAASSAFLAGFKAAPRQRRVIRPPAALREDRFVDRCIRCGNCMKVCITNGLQPVLFQAGAAAIWTPHLVPEIGYCEYRCTLCGDTCPTGAIPRVTFGDKWAAPLGLAKIDRSLCIPWAEGRECIVCEEHCPVPGKAVRLKKEAAGGKIISKPYVEPSLCVGCGICQNKCPVRPTRAIRVYPAPA